MTRSASVFPAAALALAVTLSPLAAQPPAALLSDSPSPDVSASPPAATPAPLPAPENSSAPGEATAAPRVIGTIVEPGNPPPLPQPLVPDAITAPAPPIPPVEPASPVAPVFPQPPQGLPTPALPFPAMRIPSISLTPHSGSGFGATVAENRTLPAADPSFAPFPSVPGKEDGDSPLLTEHRFDAFFIDTFASEVAAYLSRKVPGLNIMLPMNAESIRIPTMQLKNVNLREFMAALTAVSIADMANGNPGYSLSPVPGAPSILIFQQLQPTGLAAGSDSPGNASALARIPLNLGTGGGSFGGASDQSLNQNLNLNRNRNLNQDLNRTPAQNRSRTSFFDLSSILESKALKVDDITTAIRTAWSSVEGGKMPAEGALKFHQETKLLIVTGTEEYMESASAIISLLQNRAKPGRDDKDRAQAAQEQQMQAIPGRDDIDRALMAQEQQIQAIQEARDRVERDRQVEEAKSRELQDALQARIAELEVELKKAGVTAGAVKPSPEGETTNRR